MLLPNGDTAVLATDVETIPLNGIPTDVRRPTRSSSSTRTSRLCGTGMASTGLSTSRLPTNPGDITNGVVDWMHANSIAWSPADDNLIVSVRNQDWVIKINYANGTGDGHIIWKLGADGNFTLPPGTDPSAVVLPPARCDLHQQHDDPGVRRREHPPADKPERSEPRPGMGPQRADNDRDAGGQFQPGRLLVCRRGSAQILPNGNLDFQLRDPRDCSQLLRGVDRDAAQWQPDLCS